MKKRTRFLVLPVMMVLIAVSPAVAGTENMMRASADNGAFAFDIFAELRSEEGNLFFSPFSISSALAMTYGGAGGDTASQMEKALRFTGGKELTHRAFSELGERMAEIQKEGNVELSVANSIWPQSGYPFLPEYLSLLEINYGVEITPLDYARAPEPSRKKINGWVEDKTKEKIKDLIPQGSIDPLTRMVLVNAIYFKGNWADQFDPEATKTAPFTLSSGESVEVPFMARTGKYGYAGFPGFQMVELPYAGRDLSMLVLLPDAGTPLSSIEEKMNIENFETWKKFLSEEKVVLFLPRFRITWGSFSLVKALQSLGMVDAFSSSCADFSGMDGRPDWLYITDVLHKAFVDVNEEGTEAAAATAVVVGARSVAAPPVVFRADRPFLFIIQEKSTGSILFMGRVSDPSKKSDS